MSIISNISSMAETIIEEKTSQYLNSIPNTEERQAVRDRLVNSAKSMMESKLEEVNALYDKVTEGISQLQSVPSDLAQQVVNIAAVAATPTAATAALPLTSQFISFISSLKTICKDLSTALVSLTGAVTLLAQGVPSLEPIMTMITNLSEPVSSLISAVEAIPIG